MVSKGRYFGHCEQEPFFSWSYGVLLFEIFTLGDTPYVAIQPTDMLQYLDDGNRLPKPEFSTNEMFAYLSTYMNCRVSETKS